MYTDDQYIRSGICSLYLTCPHHHPWDDKWGVKREVFDKTRLDPPPAERAMVATPAIVSDAHVPANSPSVDPDSDDSGDQSSLTAENGSIDDCYSCRINVSDDDCENIAPTDPLIVEGKRQRKPTAQRYFDDAFEDDIPDEERHAAFVDSVLSDDDHSEYSIGSDTEEQCPDAYESSDDEWFPDDMSDNDDDSPVAERASSVLAEIERWSPADWERWTNLSKEPSEHENDDDIDIHGDVIAALAKGVAHGHYRLLDSGTFDHLFGWRLKDEVYDIIECSPLKISGASGPCTIKQRGKKQLQDGTILEGYLNPFLDIDLYCENALVDKEGWKISHESGTDGLGRKMIDTPTAIFFGEKMGHLFYYPASPVAFQRVCNAILEMGLSPEEEMRMHCAGGHISKLSGRIKCLHCEKGYMQALAARKGASAKYHDATLAMDTVDHGHEDCNGHRYTLNGAIKQTAVGDIYNHKKKASPSTCRGFRKIKGRLEAASSPGDPSYKIEAVKIDQGTEFQGECEEAFAKDNIHIQRVEKGRHVSTIEARNKRLEVLSVAMLSTMAEDNSTYYASQLHGELYLQSSEHLNNSSITTWQMERGITAWKDQTGKESPLLQDNWLQYIPGELALGFVAKWDRETKVSSHAAKCIYMGPDRYILGAARLVPYLPIPDTDRVRLLPAMVCKQFKVFKGCFPLRGSVMSVDDKLDGSELAKTDTDVLDQFHDLLAYYDANGTAAAGTSAGTGRR